MGKKVQGVIPDTEMPRFTVLFYSLKAFNKREEAAVYEKYQLSQFWAEDDYFTFVNTFKYEDEKVCLDKFSIFEREKTIQSTIGFNISVRISLKWN